MPKKKAALDLITDKPKKKTPSGVTRSRKVPKGELSAATVERSKVGGKAVTEAKKHALNLFEEEEKKQALRKKDRTPIEKEDASLFQSLTQGASMKAELEEDAGSVEEAEDGKKILHIKPPIIVKELAELMAIRPFKLIKDLMDSGVFANQNQSIEPEVAAKICEKHGFSFEREKRAKGAGVHKVEEVVEEPEPEPEPEVDKLVSRPPVVTVMGHVDHGKTSLLDALRKTRVAEGEAGGITQHIAAYSVPHKDSSITFVDTPGHQAFTEMRARGANVTDIVVLVIAANDGIMPTTKEAINHAKAADVEIIIAINKIDLPSADPQRVKQQLQEVDLAPEEWGGATICVEISALKGIGLEQLLEMILLQAEMLELKADPKAATRGTVIEARLEPGKGPTSTAIIQSGTLKVGTPFICGSHWGKVKSLLDDTGKPIKSAGPAAPVEVLGFSGVPAVGDEIVQMDSERKAKKLGEERLEKGRIEGLRKPAHSTLESFFDEMEEKKVFRIILKTDVAGSAEAITGALQEIKSEKISLEVLHSAAGPITESDILLAHASDAVIIGFNTKQENNAVKAAKREGVQVKLFSIIYELIDQVKEAMVGMLDPETREHSLGFAKVKRVFKLSSGRVAGCIVTKGKILRSGRARVLRDGQPVYDGGVQTLRRFNDDVNEIKNGLECGIRLGNFHDYEEDDIIECYELEKLEMKL